MIRLEIRESGIVNEGILIRSFNVIDGISGEHLKVARITPELHEFIKMLEIDVTNFINIMDFKKQNPAFTNLIETFKLYK